MSARSKLSPANRQGPNSLADARLLVAFPAPSELGFQSGRAD